LAAFAARRKVAAMFVIAGEAEAHRHDGEARRIIKLVARHAEPLPEAITGRVVERQGCVMDANAWGLAANGNSCRIRDDTVGVGLMRQGRRKSRYVATDTAGPDRVFEIVQF